jgi:hypothetical protein
MGITLSNDDVVAVADRLAYATSQCLLCAGSALLGLNGVVGRPTLMFTVRLLPDPRELTCSLHVVGQSNQRIEFVLEAQHGEDHPLAAHYGLVTYALQKHLPHGDLQRIDKPEQPHALTYTVSARALLLR